MDPMFSTLVLALSLLPPAAPQATGEAPSAQAPETFRAGDFVVERWTVDEAGRERVGFRLSTDGGETFGRDRVLPQELMLRYGEFDPLHDAPPSVDPDLAAPADGRLWIVQFVAPGLEPWREAVRALGGADRRFLAWNAGIWEMTPTTAERVRTLPFVRWVGPFHPAYKLSDELLADFRSGELAAGRYRLEAAVRGPEGQARVRDAVLAAAGAPLTDPAEGWVLEAMLSPEQLLEVLRSESVLGVDAWSAPETDMDKVRTVMGANDLETLAGWTGQGVRGEVLDAGTDNSHADWSGTHTPIFHGTVPSGAHGTCTYGINFATGASSPGGQTRGLLPDAQGVAAWYSGYSNRFTFTQETAGPVYRCVFQTNSWGSSRTRSYNTYSQEMDDIIFQLDVSILQSQSNAGNQDSRPQAWAKNIISVGGLYHYNDTNDANDAWNFGASIGPAQDGRIKPDLAAYYDSVWTSDEDPGGYVAGDDYTSFSGTSAATPIVAGHLGLIYQMWHEDAFGTSPFGSDVYDSRPHNTTAKALLLNSTTQWQFSGATHDRTRTHQGWGRPDLRTLYDDAGRLFIVDESDVLTQGGGTSYTVDVPAGEPEFRVTLVYADPPGTTSSSLHRINDLSLRVTSPGGTVYWGNEGLLSSMYSSPGGSSNVKDTVEQVIVQNPAAGTWTVDVLADEINQDSHLETPGLDADYALVARPVIGGGGGGDPKDTIDLTGVTTPTPGLPYAYNFQYAPPSVDCWLLASAAITGTTYQGHDFDVAQPVYVVDHVVSTSTGIGSFFVTFPGSISGTTWYLEVAANGPSGWRDSPPLQVDVQ